MRKPFDETAFGIVVTAIIDVVFAGLLWCLCSLPIITVGPAGTALYYTTAKSIRHERGHVASAFFSSFRSNFRISLLEWLILLAYVLIGAANIGAVNTMETMDKTLIWYLCRVMLVLPAFVSVWLFPFISRFENTVLGSLRFACFLAVKNPGRTLLMTAELALFLLIGWMIPQLIPLLPGVCCLLMSYSAEEVLITAADGSEDSNADKWYNE